MTQTKRSHLLGTTLWNACAFLMSMDMNIRIFWLLVNAYKHINAKMPKRKKQETIEDPDNMPVLRRLRETAGLTQAELARQIPDKTRTKTLNQSAISRWESGEDEPELTIPQMKALCKALGIAFEDLPDDFGPPKRSQLLNNQGQITK